MASSFWNSTHNEIRKKFNEKRHEKIETHIEDKKTYNLSDADIQIIKIYYCDQIQKLGKVLKIRQRGISTALVYFRRFYQKQNFCHFSPSLVAPTCMFLASKAEEFSIKASASQIISRMKEIDKKFNYDMNDLLNAEFYVLDGLEFHLIIYHPYRSLPQFKLDCNLDEKTTESVWRLLNDSYFTDLIMTHPPYIITLACIYLASFCEGVDLRNWFCGLNEDMKIIWAACSELLEFYEFWNKHQPFEEKANKLISHFYSK